MTREAQTIPSPSDFTDVDFEAMNTLPNPRQRKDFSDGSWEQVYGERQSTFVRIRGNDIKVEAMVFPSGVVDEKGRDYDAPGSFGPIIFDVEAPIGEDSRNEVASYAAVKVMELCND